MISIIKSRQILLLGIFIFMACMIPMNRAYAINPAAFTEWDPSTIQGIVMEVHRDSIIVNEKWIVLVYAPVSGKLRKTRIMDKDGDPLDYSDLKKGKLVFAKGGLEWDEEKKQNVLIATEIFLLDKPTNPKDGKKYFEPAKPW